MGVEASVLRTTVRVLVVFASLCVTAASITVLFLAGRAVMDIGGSCASGGPYVVARSCPKGTAWMAPVSIFVGIAAVMVYAVVCLRLPGPRLVLLAWPALFLSLGWSFWEYGLDPPDGADGVAVGWIICGVVFVVMGGAPLLMFRSRDALRGLLWADAVASQEPRRREAVRASARELVPPIQLRHERRQRAASPTADGSGVVDELERLARLHRRGDLTADEFAAAKAQVLDEEGA